MKPKRLPLILALPALLYVPLAAAGCWQPLPAASHIVFETTQAGAPFQGTFQDYGGLVCIGPGDKSQIRVSLRTASVDTKLPELDTALRGPDFFDSPRWPQALFESTAIQALGNGHYQATGRLTLRDVTRVVQVPFAFAIQANGMAQLKGELTLKRLDYHIGLGQWADTRWVGNQVKVNFTVSLKPVPAKN